MFGSIALWSTRVQALTISARARAEASYAERESKEGRAAGSFPREALERQRATARRIPGTRRRRPGF
jgi:hypothetical protein